MGLLILLLSEHVPIVEVNGFHLGSGCGFGWFKFTELVHWGEN